MDDENQPAKERLWTGDMILLVGVNIVFILLILAALLAISGAYYDAIASWLGQVFGV